MFIALVPYAIDSQREKKRLNSYERAFSQFLFELADAIRGGIDPAKAVIEFASVDRSLMKKHLKVAADGIKLGRPFEEMLGVMVDPMKSKLIKRYASLIGESSKIGGDISVVIHRAAQDMDELIEIEEERRRQLMMQAATIYIAFGVLLIVVWQLTTIYPSLGTIDFSALGTAGLPTDGNQASSSPERMSLTTMEQRFFEVVLLVGISSGIIIGVLIYGQPKMGLIHALVMSLAAAVFFAIMVFPT
jgi:Flp pilus assembly protein TadB